MAKASAFDPTWDALGSALGVHVGFDGDALKRKAEGGIKAERRVENDS